MDAQQKVEALDVIEFFVPSENGKNLYVTNLSPSFNDVAEVHTALHKLFSTYGILHEVQVLSSEGSALLPSAGQETSNDCSSAFQQDASSSSKFYAFVKFYSAVATHKARRDCNNRRYLKGQCIRVRLATRKKLLNAKRHLYITKCYELANHYLGFNGWKTRIISVKGNEESQEGVVRLSCRGIVELALPSHGVRVTGVGVGEMSWNPTDYTMKLEAMCRAKKQAYQRAVEQAFSQIILVVLSSGKVFADVNPCIDDSLEPEAALDCDTLLKVTELEEEPEEDSDDNMPPITDVDTVNQQILAELDDN